MSERAGSGAAAAAAIAAKEKRKLQLKRWRGSCTDLEPGEPRWLAGAGAVSGSSPRRVRFEAAAEFLAACASGDAKDAEEMLRGGADVNCANTDGISALHQACIDENLEMVEFLLAHNANVDQPDNEGWTPLHVAASCGYSEIVECLINHDANIAAVNSDGQLPVDLAEEDYMETLLQDHINKQGIDVESARREEEELMLQHARQWLNSGKIEEVSHPKSGANALHVAAAKGYIEVMRLLLQAGFSVHAQDKDGWTPLHAAAHWGMEESCRLLVEHFCDMEALNNSGQTPFDVADEDILGLLEDLQKKQDDLRTEKEEKMKRAIIETSIQQQQPPPAKPRKSSVCRMSSKEKISVQDLSKERKTLETLPLDESKKEESSSSSSETEEASESDSECETERNKKPVLSNNTNSLNGTGAIPLAPPVTLAPSNLKGPSVWHGVLDLAIAKPFVPRLKESYLGLNRVEESNDFTGETWMPKAQTRDDVKAAKVRDTDLSTKPSVKQEAPPAAWRTGLWKTGSYVTLPDAQHSPEKIPLGGIKRSASSPRLGSDGKDKGKHETRLARVPPTPIGRMLSVPETPAEHAVSSTYQQGRDPSSQVPKDIPGMLTSATDFKERRRLYLTPVRDEESESQRKARSRHARQSRRSTQGVTLTDLKEAEKTLGGATEKKNQDQLEKREEEESDRKGRSLVAEDKEVGSRLRPSTTEGVSLTSTFSRCSVASASIIDINKDSEDCKREEGDSDYSNQNRLSVRDRRKARKERRFTGKPEFSEEGDSTEQMNSVDTLTHRYGPSLSDRIPGRIGTPSHSSARVMEDGNNDFRKMYEVVLSENVRLKTELREAQSYLTQANQELERVLQRQGVHENRPAQLELERFERRAFERRTAELEEQLKVLTDLKTNNQRLKDENAALIRVISKLSK
ncbi:protein phosphatase 1 regulatory subunit 12B-like isoform X1 [Stegostoma tigrinum]|uniref:protein phosphatase 1 regulatory subunit 12B-like isoform X1 n=1 Tax=Stegostoma tigrinum TaxID=3053191 RepID=UPI0028709EB3|nr:protein phosphatase 1 regulatory subunit 12B-like isoform X1 [Stegostoma tigrinum]